MLIVYGNSILLQTRIIPQVLFHTLKQTIFLLLESLGNITVRGPNYYIILQVAEVE